MSKQLRFGSLKALLAALAAAGYLAGGCSSVGRASRSTYFEANLVGTWRDVRGNRFRYEGDGSWRTSYGDVAQYRVSYPFIYFTYSSGRQGMFTVVDYQFGSEPKKMTVRDQLGFEQTLTR